MELKDYQSAALEAFVRWRDALASAQAQADTTITAFENLGVDIPAGVRDYPRAAWEQLVKNGEIENSAGAYVNRSDDAGRPIPHACFKVPTGGGKTLLAEAALERLNRQRGLTLWITPTRAIYEQTKTALRNREHPYRQMLERAAEGRVKLLEKDDLFTGGDVANYLCVMLLMLPATNRQKGKEFLRMFRDSGRYPSLFPDSDDVLGEQRLLNEYSDLERLCVNPNCLVKQDRRNECRCGEQWKKGPVKRSLFNVFKMLRPVVVLDEAHKAYGKPDTAQEFVQSVNRLAPSLVIELSATPNKGISNLLVDISGVELKQEQMIKLPVQVDCWPNAEWKTTLSEAHDKLEQLAAEAQSLETSEGRYIRPIAVVRVERTGRDQRGPDYVHAEDVREYLTLNLGVPPEAVIVKSAENDELGKKDLLSEYSPVRWVITRAALMEGWDCSFAYLLVMLDNTHAARALTQLVGRVMRQPHARRTGRELHRERAGDSEHDQNDCVVNDRSSAFSAHHVLRITTYISASVPARRSTALIIACVPSSAQPIASTSARYWRATPVSASGTFVSCAASRMRRRSFCWSFTMKPGAKSRCAMRGPRFASCQEPAAPPETASMVFNRSAPCAPCEDERLRNRSARSRDEHLVHQFRRLPHAGRAHERDALAHRLEDGQAAFERLRRAPCHDGQRRLLRSPGTAADGGVEHRDAARRQTFGQRSRFGGGDGAHVYQHRALRHGAGEPALAFDDCENVRGIRDHRDDDGGLPPDLRHGIGYSDAVRLQRLRPGRSPVVGDDVEPGFRKVPGHRSAHDACSDDSHCFAGGHQRPSSAARAPST